MSAPASEALARGPGGALEWLRIALQLGKIRVTFVVSISVLTGYLVFAETFHIEALLAMGGVFLVAAGSSALNQVQELHIDRQMERTARRPLPSGRIEPAWATFIALLYMVLGFNLLANLEAHTLTVLGLTALAVFWYNGVYTYLKRVTAFAVVPGALVGAIPPAIGWSAAGGILADPEILALCFFLLVWQIPHFWLLLLRFGSDYERAGLPSATALFGPAQLARITLIWILATAVAGTMAASQAGMRFPWNLLFLLATIWIAVQGLRLLRKVHEPGWELGAFMRLNLYALAAMALLITDALVRAD